MKLKVLEETKEKGFKPVTLELTLETVEEARLLFHAFNCRGLLDAFKKVDYYLRYYSKEVEREFQGVESIIQGIIEDQGFEV